MAQDYPQPRNYERSRLIQVGPDAVFDFVRNVATLPDYLPTLRNVREQAEGRVVVETEIDGKKHSADGYLRASEDRRRLEWGSDDGTYRGEMDISDEVGRSRVIVRLTFGRVSDFPERVEAETDRADAIDTGLDDALDSLKNILEGTGGKVQSVAD